MSNLVELELSYMHETDDAYLLNDGDEDHWIPKSQIEDGYNLGYFAKGDTVLIEIPEWLAEKLELV